MQLSNNSQVYGLSFNRSRKKGECGLSNDGTHINFPIFGMEPLLIKVLVMMMLFMLPKYCTSSKSDKKMFFEKMAKLVEFTCKELNNSGETIKWNNDWYTYSFQDNILEPNTNHIQSVMGLSDVVTEQVVRASDYVINDWNGEENADENN